jgi:hypothetical protein
MRQLLSGTQGLDQAADLARALASGKHSTGGLLLVGTPDDEPWHFGAHLDDEARWAGVPTLAPTWVRWNPPPDAPPHLAVGLDRLSAVGRGETLLVATPTGAIDPLLERVSDARKHGALILAVEGAPTELQSLAHEAVSIGDSATMGYDLTTHLVSVAAGESASGRSHAVRVRLRDRLARMLERVSGPDNA